MFIYTLNVFVFFCNFVYILDFHVLDLYAFDPLFLYLMFIS